MPFPMFGGDNVQNPTPGLGNSGINSLPATNAQVSNAQGFANFNSGFDPNNPSAFTSFISNLMANNPSFDNIVRPNVTPESLARDQGMLNQEAGLAPVPINRDVMQTDSGLSQQQYIDNPSLLLSNPPSDATVGQATNLLGNDDFLGSPPISQLAPPPSVPPTTLPASQGESTPPPGFDQYIDAGNVGDPSSGSWSGLDPAMRERLENVMGGFERFLPAYQDALNAYSNLPGQIDQWTNDTMNRYRMSNSDISDIYGEVGKRAAQRGVVGGSDVATERGTMLSGLARNLADQQAQVMREGTQQKVNNIMGLPQAASYGLGMLPGMIGLGRESGSYQTDPTRWPGMLLDMIKSGYTG